MSRSASPRLPRSLRGRIHRRKLDVTVYTGYTLEELWAMHGKDVDDLLAQADVPVDAGSFWPSAI